MDGIGQLRDWVLTAPDNEFWGFIVFAFVATIAAFIFSFVFLRRARVIEDTPTSRIRSAAQGYVELVGTTQLMDGTPIVAPLTTTPCAWYRYKVEKMGEKHSRIVESGISDGLFLLVGETGRCVIDPDGAVVTPSIKQVWYESSYPSRRNKVFRSGFLGSLGARYRYTEERMHPGDPLYAIGMFMSVGGNNDSFNTREEIALLLKEWKQDHQALLQKFDTNQDGQIDLQEWELVRKAAAQQVRQEQTERGLKDLTNIMTKPKHDTRPYLLSVRPQYELVRHYKIKAAASLAGFFILGSTVVWMTTLRMISQL